MPTKCHKVKTKKRPLKKLGSFGGSLNLQAEKVVYSESLKLWREFKWEVWGKKGADRAQSCMDLCLLLVYCAVNPG